MKKTIFYSVVFFLYGIMTGNAGDPVRIKNFREIYSSYASITGVGADDVEIQLVFNNIKDRLPKYGIPQEFNNNTVLAMIELSGYFCKKAIAREENQTHGERLIFSDIDFTRGPSQFSDFLISRISQRLAVMFWLRDVKQKEIEVMNSLFAKSTSAQDDSIDALKNILQIMCANYASSMAFLVK
ncbi:MAG: hypothetical protein A4S09_08955 [Proteobacteria bacterium SG_bin7]|nr:MAG: hypothetical protein A4S09_08955 [Proteobacteria bacterium SG_bin7]